MQWKPAMLRQRVWDGESSSTPVHGEYNGFLSRGSSEDLRTSHLGFRVCMGHSLYFLWCF